MNLEATLGVASLAEQKSQRLKKHKQDVKSQTLCPY